ncbi:PQBP1 [Acanthosepion pharaonis]|uniref:PQBP1 n=1 Tax=Acanthosepion pharaonis TaxID=158019 RepID=A0A812DG72_ACAPH|nr:PQBP1 [Sepia pharaonis]
MPLPPALLARLSKRGIIKTPEAKKTEDVEEVFAEDYDEPTEPFTDLDAPETDAPAAEDEPDFNMIRLNRYYYWNMLTDQVSWLAPLHPKAQITMSISKVSESLKVPSKTGNDSDGMENDSDMDDDDDDDVSGSDLDEDSEEEEDGRKRRDWNSKRETKRAQEELDPMDPAAYSNAPRGTWSTGLDKRGEAKTGADVTATGPLYQQRPYPAPGDVLRMNRQLEDN